MLLLLLLLLLSHYLVAKPVVRDDRTDIENSGVEEYLRQCSDTMLAFVSYCYVLLLPLCMYRSAVENICGRDNEVDHLAIPAACFTHPEIAMVGLTEEQAKEKVTCFVMTYFATASLALDTRVFLLL